MHVETTEDAMEISKQTQFILTMLDLRGGSVTLPSEVRGRGPGKFLSVRTWFAYLCREAGYPPFKTTQRRATSNAIEQMVNRLVQDNLIAVVESRALDPDARLVLTDAGRHALQHTGRVEIEDAASPPKVPDDVDYRALARALLAEVAAVLEDRDARVAELRAQLDEALSALDRSQNEIVELRELLDEQTRPDIEDAKLSAIEHALRAQEVG